MNSDYIMRARSLCRLSKAAFTSTLISALALIPFRVSADVTEWQYKLIQEGKVYKCVQWYDGCVTWDYVDPENYVMNLIVTRPSEEPEPPPLPPPETRPIKPDQEGFIRMILVGCENIPSATHRWEMIDGKGFVSMPETPNNTNLGTNIVGSPTISCTIETPEETEWFLWVYGGGPNASADSINYSLNGKRVGTLDFRHQNPWSNDRQGSSNKASIFIPNGTHKIGFHMREDSVWIALAILTEDPEFVPNVE